MAGKPSRIAKLKRLFSTDVIIRDTGGGNLKVVDVNSIQRAGQIRTNTVNDRYTRVHTTTSAPYFNSTLNYQALRTQLYTDYEAMDTDAIVSSALDIVADESSLKNSMGEILQIKSTNEKIQQVLYNLHYDILNIEYNIWSWIRQMVKYGDMFLKLDIAEEYGIVGVVPYTPYHMARIEGFDENNPAAVKFMVDPDGLGGSTLGVYGSTFNFENIDQQIAKGDF